VESFLRKAEKVIDWVTDLGAAMGGILTAIMTLIVTYAVVLRYLLNRPIGWSEEISVYLMIWAVFLGTAYTLKEDAHIGVDLLMKKIPEKMRPWFLLFHYAVGILFLSVLFYKGIQMVDLSFVLDTRSMAIDFPLYISYLAVPFGSALLVLQLVLRTMKLCCQWLVR
jgi:TRAP-type C4-dicarboxylate transport system permease small subunit